MVGEFEKQTKLPRYSFTWNNREESLDRFDLHFHPADTSAANGIDVDKLDVIHFGGATDFINAVFESDSSLYARVKAERCWTGHMTSHGSLCNITQKEQCCPQSRRSPTWHCSPDWCLHTKQPKLEGCLTPIWGRRTKTSWRGAYWATIIYCEQSKESLKLSVNQQQ